MTSSVQRLSPELQLQLIRLVQQFDSFTSDNDPYQEHNLGKVTLDGEDYFFKIDYYFVTLYAIFDSQYFNSIEIHLDGFWLITHDWFVNS